MYFYKARKYERVILNGLIKNILNVITIDRNVVNNGTKEIEIHNNKFTNKVTNTFKV